MARRPVRIERGLIPLIDVFALLIGAVIILLTKANFRPSQDSPAWEGPRLLVACRADGRCFYQGQVIFTRGAVEETIEAQLLARLASEAGARVLLALPPPEDPASRFRYTDLQTLLARWGGRVELLP
jgi:hypothetical protein